MDNNYYTEKIVVVKEYNYNIIKDEINEFLKTYDSNIRCFGLEQSLYSSLSIYVKLEYFWNDRWNSYDEDYDDEIIDNYFKELSKKVGCRVGVPSYYYPK